MNLCRSTCLDTALFGRVAELQRKRKEVIADVKGAAQKRGCENAEKEARDHDDVSDASESESGEEDVDVTANGPDATEGQGSKAPNVPARDPGLQEEPPDAPRLYLLADAKKLHIPHCCQGWSFLNSKKATHVRFEPADLDVHNDLLEKLLTSASTLPEDGSKQQRMTNYLKESAYPEGLRHCVSDFMTGLNHLNDQLLGKHNRFNGLVS